MSEEINEELNRWLWLHLFGKCPHQTDNYQYCRICGKYVPLSQDYVPNYSTDYNAAFAVVDAMIARGWDWDAGTEQPEFGNFYSSFFIEDDDKYYPAYGDTLPETIARAAKAALEGEK